MKKYINVVHVTGLADGQLVEGQDSACVVCIRECPPKQGICVSECLFDRIRLGCQNIASIEDCTIYVESKSIKSNGDEKQIDIKYNIVLEYKTTRGCSKRRCQDGTFTFSNVEGNVAIDNISVLITNPPQVRRKCRCLHICTEIQVEY